LGGGAAGSLRSVLDLLPCCMLGWDHGGITGRRMYQVRMDVQYSYGWLHRPAVQGLSHKKKKEKERKKERYNVHMV
jgi:hypothetical protein